MAKRISDIMLSLLGLLITAPLLLGIALFIKAGSPGPALYRGVRVGKDGKRFEIFKFRTMVVNAEDLGGSSTPEDDPRITSLGKVLRAYKLDELPQLLNVLKGEMSFVGPRPQVPWAVELYSAEEKLLLNVRPGITDYASIRFRNEAEILRGSDDPDRDYLEKIAPEKIRLGLEYIHNRSLWVDAKIMLETVRIVFKRTA